MASKLGPGKKSLERGSTFRVPRHPMKRSRRRRLDREQRAQAGAFHASIEGKPCVMCGRDAEDAHHVVEAQLLRRDHPERVYDVDNALPLCRGCHEGHTNASRRVPRSHLFAVNLEFAYEVLGVAAESYLARRYPA